jgi:high-affinity Fe2+/Pb2+ permease
MNKKTAAWIWLAIVASIVLYFAAATGYLIRLGLQQEQLKLYLTKTTITIICS